MQIRNRWARRIAGLAMGLFSFGHQADGQVRQPAVAGTFYPSNADELRREVQAYLDAADVPPVKGEILAAMAPHAGYRYSAAIAAYVHKAIADVPFDTLVVIGHDAHAKGIVALLPRAQEFVTPLGRVPVDTELAKALTEKDRRIIYHEPSHARDHTIEVHLPFLQVQDRTCQVLPVLFGEPSVEHCTAFAQALGDCAGKRRLFVLASTDLCHYPTSELAHELDAETLAKVKAFDLPGLLEYLSHHQSGAHGVQTAMCASGGVGTAMLFAQAGGADTYQILKTANSGDVSGDTSRVVGYAAGIFLWATAEGEEHGTDEKGFSLPDPVCRELLALARKRIETAAARETLDYTPPEGLRAQMEEPTAVFVTLHKRGRLRGCIGTTVARDPLWKAVYELAHSAAFRDPRFPPVTAAEVTDLHIEISVLSPLTPVANADAIIPGKHGVVVREAFQTGLFLPQVWEQLPDKDEFLTVLCEQKAHLPGNAWRDGKAELSVFAVFAFEEEKKD